MSYRALTFVAALSKERQPCTSVETRPGMIARISWPNLSSCRLFFCDPGRDVRAEDYRVKLKRTSQSIVALACWFDIPAFRPGVLR